MMAYGMTKYFQPLRSLKIRECFIVVCFVLVKPVGKFAYCSCSSVAGTRFPVNGEQETAGFIDNNKAADFSA